MSRVGNSTVVPAYYSIVSWLSERAGVLRATARGLGDQNQRASALVADSLHSGMADRVDIRDRPRACPHRRRANDWSCPLARACDPRLVHRCVSMALVCLWLRVDHG